jgi:hypothetical protein
MIASPVAGSGKVSAISAIHCPRWRLQRSSLTLS